MKIRSLLSTLLFTLAVSFADTCSQSNAATVRLYVKARTGAWAEIVEGSNTGGKFVVRNGTLITDRASRGEIYTFTVDADSESERECKVLIDANSYRNSIWSGVYQLVYQKPSLWIPEAPNKYRFVQAVGPNLTVPPSPLMDNVIVRVGTPLGIYARRLPIGLR